MFKRNKPQANALPGQTAATTSDSILRDLAADYMHDKKVRRRWRIGLFVLFGVYLLSASFVGLWSTKGTSYSGSHTALVELNGVIGLELGATSDQVNESLRNAFEATSAKGVVVRINSPGGTPVQSAEINDEMKRLKAKYPDKPLYAVVSDLAASGGYFVAVGADEIYANRSSLVGSIGVRMDGFGFVEAMKKYGVERRSLTAGENKALLDPFLPMQASQEAHVRRMLDQVHAHFIEAVKQGRGERISADPSIYSGLIWSGDEAKQLGLIDEFGSLDTVARDVIGAEEIVNYTRSPSFWEQLNQDLGVSIGRGIGHVLGGAYQMR